MHLKDDELIDLAEGTLTTDARIENHLGSCDGCRRKLADLRATLKAVAAAEVPEPSPLFWDHFSRRVHDAVEAEGRPRRMPVPVWAWLVPAAAVVALIVAVFVPRAFHSAGQSTARASVAPQTRETLGEVTDPSLTLVADLTDEAGWETVHEAGLSPRGSAEHAVTHLTEPELRELQRLLKAELAHSSD